VFAHSDSTPFSFPPILCLFLFFLLFLLQVWKNTVSEQDAEIRGEWRCYTNKERRNKGRRKKGARENKEAELEDTQSLVQHFELVLKDGNAGKLITSTTLVTFAPIDL
jgi:hypothetical protein